jgi:hypothetical protein
MSEHGKKIYKTIVYGYRQLSTIMSCTKETKLCLRHIDGDYFDNLSHCLQEALDQVSHLIFRACGSEPHADSA